tara:strand:+ start:8919 stop:10250 length:1332 start_codon:yes stop_codon:yes gene_type:complete
MGMETATIETKKKLSPALRFKGFDGEWKNFGFNELILKANQGVNTTTEKVKYSENGITVIKSNNIGENVIDFSGVNYVDVETYERLNSNCKPEKGDILYCNIGSALGSAAILNTKGKVLINWNVYRIQYKKDVINVVLFCQLLNLKKRTIMRYATLSTMPFISSKAFNHIYFNIPDFPEQQKIASFLSAVDEKIQQLTKKKELLEQYKKGVMQQLFSQKIRFRRNINDPEVQAVIENGRKKGLLVDPNMEYPDWEEKFFKDVVIEYRLGGNYTNTEVETIYPLIKMGNLGRGKMNTKKLEYIPIDEEIYPKDKIEYGDLFFNTRNTLDLVGKVSIWRNELPIAYYNSNLMYLKFEDNFFMNYRLNSNEGVKELKRLATGTTSVAAIYTKDLLKLILNIPCLEEQQKIATYLSNIDSKIDSVNQQITQTQTFKKGLLQQMFVAA